MSDYILVILFIVIPLLIYFVIPFTILMINMPKIKEARKKAQKSYSPWNCNTSATEHLYFVSMPRQDIVEILSEHDYLGRTISRFEPAGMLLILQDSGSESRYRIVIEEIKEGCIVKALLTDRSYHNTSHGKLNSFFKERLGACGISYEQYSEKKFEI